MLLRPRNVPEWVWVISGAALLALFGLLPVARVGAAIAKGTDVYLFLGGMMLLAELARREGVFDWIAAFAVRAARGSRFALLALVYGAGIAVTVVLSNDATAVVLTPAVAAAVRAAKVEPLPYLFACAFVANAASFVLPISNPANLVVFAGAMPALPLWLSTFGLSSLLAIAATFGALALLMRRDLHGAAAQALEIPTLGKNGRVVVGGILLTATALVIASAKNGGLGITTSVCAALVFAGCLLRDRTVFDVVRSISWSVLALVAGLFILVEGLDVTGFGRVASHGAATMATWSTPAAAFGAALVTSLGSNLINNLPAGLIAGSSVATLHGHDVYRAAVAIGIDLGPNLSVTGSLATVLWLTALRRERIDVSAWSFLRIGAITMPVALVPAVVALFHRV